MYLQSVLQYGWPLRCFETESRQVRPGPTSAETLGHAGLVPGWSPPDHRGRRLPLRPIALGLTVNTALCTLVLWLLELLLTSRRRLRRWRGRCLACGYDLRGAEHERCPECGTAPQDVSR
jgi:hypothetical protein